MNNQDLVKLFRNVAATYSILDERKYKFQIIAYIKAADAVEHASTELKNLYQQGQLGNVPNIGKSIEGHLEELFKTGKVKHFDEIMKSISPAVYPLIDIPSFGPKKAFKLVTTFKLTNPKTVIEDIKKLAIEGRIRELDGFGEKSEADILRAIEEYKTGTTKSNRMVLPYAFSLAQDVISYMKKSKDVLEIQPLGSLRRMVSTVGDIDLAISSHNPEPVLEHFINFPPKERVIERGPYTASILIGGGRHVDLLVLNPDMWGSLLQHFTGSKHHNVALREHALKKNLSLSERGIKIISKRPEPSPTASRRAAPVEGKLITFKTEPEFYKYLGMDWVPPEIRENNGEIDLALKHKLPKLVELSDMKGDLHIHSNYQIDSSHDYGTGTMEEMLKKAESLHYKYLGFSEHNPAMNRPKEKIYSILKSRYEKIEKLKKSNKNIRIINLLEVDILADGKLALDEKAFEYVDAAIVSIHSSFNTPRDKMTDRILKGLSHPKAKIFAHPTGRLLNERTGYEVDWNRLLPFCKENNKALEINAWPERLDLPDILVKQAKELGIKFVIDTDSHAVNHMDNMMYGVAVARRGWCEAPDILNTYSYKDFVAWLNS